MPKNIVVCCDGTGNEYGDSNSNVVKIYQTLIRQAGVQEAYYHPGVGTMGAKSALTKAGKIWTKFRGLAFGYGLSDNIADAYRFLMENFEPGDQVYIFGFSRGAYTARALCGMLQMFGLLSPGNEGLIPYALRLFKRIDRGVKERIGEKFKIARGFEKTFSRECKPHFLGVWDTVSSVGWILDPIGLKPGRLPYTRALTEVDVIRHAVSIDERRAFFRQNLVKSDPQRIAGGGLKQVWFAGVHSDVGGSYPEAQSGLAKIALRWMLREAKGAGMLVNDDAVAKILGGDPAYVKPLPNAMQHNSLTPAWWLGEVWPKWTKHLVSQPGVEPEEYRGWPRLNLFQRRFIPPNPCIHESVEARMRLVPDYQPGNLSKPYTVEHELPPDVYPVRLETNQTLMVGVHSRAKWNDTTIQVAPGETYRFEATGTWYDASIRCGPSGYERHPRFIFRLIESWRRAPKANWFALVGAVGQDECTAFVIGDRTERTFETGGVVHCFANDLSFMTGNNSGYVKLTVTRL